MKLLKELLNEVYGRGRDVEGEAIWRAQAAQAASAEAEHWIITPQGKKYGPFPNRNRALGFLQNRLDIPRNSQLKAIAKGSRI